MPKKAFNINGRVIASKTRQGIAAANSGDTLLNSRKKE